MPLYLVRWPGTRASLVKAANEEELIALIDEIDLPGLFNWSVYRGPLWIDFSLPVKATLEERHPGPLRPDEYQVTDVSEFLDGRLRVSVPEAEVVLEMEEAVLRGAFPKTAAVFDARRESDEAPSADLLRAAIVADVVDHDQACALDGARIGPDLGLSRTTTWIFRRLEDGSFAEAPAKTFLGFLCGDVELRPEPDGAVHICFVEVTLKKKRPVEARLSHWSRFPTEKDGKIRAAYNAREFMVEPKRAGAAAAPEGVLDTVGKFLEQRKKALEWTPEAVDVLGAAEAVNAKAGDRILVDD